ncbi:winged helix-turn-helix domain-containing protein [Halorientalis halophila]|uniref:winged helix-turn-helix domain-containing protein n=1 Tax=Halorientalis halophila TaxID=3108499 RepID=UPI003009F95C
MSLRYDAGDDAGPTPTEVLSAVDQPSRKNIVGTVVGHPKGMPSFKEIDHMNPSLASSTVSEHLDRLRAAGVVDVVRWTAEGRDATAPKAFYYLTDAAREILDRNGVFGEDGYRSVYEQVTLPEEIETHLHAERPAVDAATVDLN